MNNKGVKMLSILIPTIPSRKRVFNALRKKVMAQRKYCHEVHPTLGQIEVIWHYSESFINGGPSIGDKRQTLLDAAKSKYLCYLDDDEDISPDYCETLLRLCNLDKDVCTFRSFVKVQGYWALVDLSIDNKNEQLSPAGITRRTPWHICPVRSDYAKLYEFPDSNYGEDYEWFEKVLKHCNDEAHTDNILHNYNHGKHSEADKIKTA